MVQLLKWPYQPITKPSPVRITNNRSEIQALLIALFLCKWINTLYPESTFDIITDSMYTQKSITTWMQKWLKSKSAQKNMDLLLPAYHIYSLKYIRIIHVHSHVSETESLKHPDFKKTLYIGELIIMLIIMPNKV